MTKAGGGHNLPALRYPTELARHVFHLPLHRRHSSRRQWGHRPMISISVAKTHAGQWEALPLIREDKIHQEELRLEGSPVVGEGFIPREMCLWRRLCTKH